MLKKAPAFERVVRVPQRRDLVKAPKKKKKEGIVGDPEAPPQRNPEPRLPYKHVLNPPIVTIFGAGVAGLTAAHELVERGFLVQVLEANEDPTSPGRPLVGGMAANQPARVRANIEDLHEQLILDSTQSTDARERLVLGWLLRCLAFVRSRWVFTEYIMRCHPTLFSRPGDEGFERFEKALKEELDSAYAHYKARWIWDLVMRALLLDETYETKPLPQDRVEQVAELCKSWLDLPPTELAKRIWHTLKADSKATLAADPKNDLVKQVMENLPTDDDVDRYAPSIDAAFDREFLCFKLVPYAISGADGAEALARELYGVWATELGKSYPNSCLSDPKKPPPVRSAFLDSPSPAWVDLEFVEQRLPGEHGYRFFPSFYRHLDDTMKRIPLFDGTRATARTVLDNLRPTIFQGIGFTRQDIADNGHPPIWDDTDTDPCRSRKKHPKPPQPPIVVEVPRTRATSIEGFRDRTDRLIKRIGGTQRDAVLLFAKLLRFMTTSPERRRDLYEKKSWHEFVEIEKFSRAIQAQIKSAAQALLAFSVDDADARSYGDMITQILLDGLDDGSRVDRTLNGPTSDAWLEPWRDYLERQGVRFFCLELEQLALKTIDGEEELVPLVKPPFKRIGGGVTDQRSAAFRNETSQQGKLLTWEDEYPGRRPDFYVLALDQRRTAELVGELGDPKAAPDFLKIRAFDEELRERKAKKKDDERLNNDVMHDMTGVQFFFDAKTSIGQGHMYFPYAEWGLSSISQSEFWYQSGSFSSGYFGVLSVDICTTGKFEDPDQGSFWATIKFMGEEPPGAPKNTPGVGHFLAAREIWNQIGARISEKDCLAEPRCVHIDRNITRAAGNMTPYLGAAVGLDEYRPGRSPHGCAGEGEIAYSINHQRWVVCGTFMATHTRITTMESANESARHAVKAILERLEKNDSTGVFSAHSGPADVQIESLKNKTYNGASSRTVYDEPDVWNPEDEEPEDFDFFRRVDRRLQRLHLPHMFDILDFDRKLEHALDAVDIYRGERPLRDYLGGMLATLDTVLIKEGGRAYDKTIETKWNEAKGSVSKLSDNLPGDMFPEMKDLLTRFKKMLDAF